MSWRYIAVRVDGTGHDEVIHPDVPLTVPGLTDVLSGPPGFTGTVEARYAGLEANDDRPLFQEWNTAIFPERDGLIQPGGGIIRSAVPNNKGGLDIEVVGYSGYPDKTPYTEVRESVKEDALDIYRHIWIHLQNQPNGNLGLTIDDTKSGIRLGEPATAESNDGPYRLAWYLTKDLAQVIDDLTQYFDYHETHFWQDGRLRHHIELGAPLIGVRRDDLELVVGDNVWVQPSYASQNEQYATSVLTLGSGEGRDMVHATASVAAGDGRLRRIALVEDKAIQEEKAALANSIRNLKSRNILPSVSTLLVREHPNAPISAIKLGDEYPFKDASNPWTNPNTYVRVVSRTIDPKRDDQATLTVVRSGSEAA